MSTTKEAGKNGKQFPIVKTETDLNSERERILAEAAELGKELESLEERRASELAGDANSKRLDEIEELIIRFTRERDRVLGRVKAIDERLIPAARREATRVTMEARVKEYDRLRGLDEQAKASVRGLLEAARKVKAGIPWKHPHPQFIMHKLAEEIRFDAAELGEKPPTLEQPSRFEAEFSELQSLVREIVGIVEYLHSSYGPLTERGHEAARRKRAEAAA